MTRAVKPNAKMLTLTSPKQSMPDQAWMLTFADLTSLLLCFFILMYATQVIDRDRWQALTGSFKATFSPSAVAVAVVPSGQMNAMPVVTVRRGPAYLDTVLRQRLQDDPAWQALRGTEDLSEGAFRYAIPTNLQNPADPITAAAWQRLGAAVLTWQTPVAVRVVVPEGQPLGPATARAWALAAAAAAGGGRVTAEVRRGSIAALQWVIYSAD